MIGRGLTADQAFVDQGFFEARPFRSLVGDQSLLLEDYGPLFADGIGCPSAIAKPENRSDYATIRPSIGQGLAKYWPSWAMIGPSDWPKVERLCHYASMAKTVIVKLTDDIDGGDADETIHFSLDGKSYEIDVNTRNAAQLRAAFTPFIEKGRTSNAGGRARASRPSSAPGEKTLFSQLSDDEKKRFRVWADMATARRISDSRVNSWVAAGKP